MKTNNSFIVDIHGNKNTHYSFVFIPISNIQNENLGYLVYYLSDTQRDSLENNSYLISFLIFVILSLVFYYIYNRANYAKNLEFRVKEKTFFLDKSLNEKKEVNKELEKKSYELQDTVRQIEEINDDLEESNLLLEQQKALYHIVFEDSFDGISIININENTFVECNNSFLEMLNAKSKDEVLDMQPSDLSPEFQPDGKSSFDKASEMIKTAITKGNNLFEWKHKKCTGEEFWVEVSLTHFVLNGQQMLYVIWKDIDEKKKIEEKNHLLQKETKKMNALLKLQTTELKNHKDLLEEKVKEQTKELLVQNEQLSIHKSELEAQNEELRLIQNRLKETTVELENLFNGIPYPVVLITENLEIKTENVKFSTVFLEGKQYQNNLNLLTLVSKENIEEILDLIKSQDEEEIIKMKTSEDGERRFKLKKDKHPVDKKLIILSLIDVENELSLQEKMKEQETQFLQQSKMAVLGDMIGNIAHQWRQPLNAISVAASGLEVQYKLGMLSEKDIEQLIPTILENIDYLSNTIETFRNFITKDKTKKVVLIQDEIDIALNLVKDTLHNNFIRLENNLDYEKPIKSIIIENEITEVIINICNNARDILVEKKIKDAWIKIDLISKNNKAIITIEDNGGGVPDSIIDKIFEPYFTTKHQSKGTGLGLHMSYRLVVESMNGNLHVENTQNGAKFFIELPINSCEL